MRNRPSVPVPAAGGANDDRSRPSMKRWNVSVAVPASDRSKVSQSASSSVVNSKLETVSTVVATLPG